VPQKASQLEMQLAPLLGLQSVKLKEMM